MHQRMNGKQTYAIKPDNQIVAAKIGRSGPQPEEQLARLVGVCADREEPSPRIASIEWSQGKLAAIDMESF